MMQQINIKDEDIIARESVVPLFPWVLQKSKQYQGRYFFYNTANHKTSWTLHKKYIFTESADANTTTSATTTTTSFNGDNGHLGLSEKKATESKNSIIKQTQEGRSSEHHHQQQGGPQGGSRRHYFPPVSPLSFIPSPSIADRRPFFSNNKLTLSSLTLTSDEQQDSSFDTRSITTDGTTPTPTKHHSFPSPQYVLSSMFFPSASSSYESSRNLPIKKATVLSDVAPPRSSNPPPSSSSSSYRVSRRLIKEKETTYHQQQQKHKEEEDGHKKLTMRMKQQTISTSTKYDDHDDNINIPIVNKIESQRRQQRTEMYVSEDDEIPLFQVTNALGMGGFSLVMEVQNINKITNNKSVSLKENEKKKGYIRSNNQQNQNQNNLYAMKKIFKSRCTTQKSQLQQAEEINILNKISPSLYILKHEYCFEDYNYIYIIFDKLYGDLFYYMYTRMVAKLTMDKNNTFNQRNNKDGGNNNGNNHTTCMEMGVFSEQECQIILAELAIALEHIHSHGIIHRDLKLENIGIDLNGHIKLIDFGLSIQINHHEDEDTKMSALGSLSSMAPELITSAKNIGGTFTDWWAYGILAYELFTGKSPWSSPLNNVTKLKYEILHHDSFDVNPKKHFPYDLSLEGKDFICCLLLRDYHKRLGCNSKSDHYIRNHSFFKHLKWNEFEKQLHTPVFRPIISSNPSTSSPSSSSLSSSLSSSSFSSKICLSEEERIKILECYKETLTSKEDEGDCQNSSHETRLRKDSPGRDGGTPWMLGLPRVSEFLLV